MASCFVVLLNMGVGWEDTEGFGIDKRSWDVSVGTTCRILPDSRGIVVRFPAEVACFVSLAKLL